MPDSQKHIYLISREALDIVKFLVDGLISLIIVHRDHVSKIYPLLPWLHSSEACEHVFVLPKLNVKLSEAIFNSQLHWPSDMKAQATGYNHTYLDAHDLDFLVLARYPSQPLIDNTADCAIDEAEGLIELLGVIPSVLETLNPDISLPSISSWFTDSDDDLLDPDAGASLVDEPASDDSDCNTTVLQQFLSSADDNDPPTQATIALSMNEQMHLYILQL